MTEPKTRQPKKVQARVDAISPPPPQTRRYGCRILCVRFASRPCSTKPDPLYRLLCLEPGAFPNHRGRERFCGIGLFEVQGRSFTLPAAFKLRDHSSKLICRSPRRMKPPHSIHCCNVSTTYRTRSPSSLTASRFAFKPQSYTASLPSLTLPLEKRTKLYYLLTKCWTSLGNTMNKRSRTSVKSLPKSRPHSGPK